MKFNIHGSYYKYCSGVYKVALLQHFEQIKDMIHTQTISPK